MKTILNKRLSTISAFINENDKVIDIGCDHGLLGIDLVLHKDVIKMISSDINSGPLQKALENNKKYHVEDKILLKQGNGLETIDNEIDTVVISGMGGITITNILKDIKKYPHIKKIIISPNNDFPLTRKEITKHHFKLDKEVMVYEKGKYYLVSCYLKGKDKINYYFGKLNFQDENARNYYQEIYNTNKRILSNLSLKNKLKRINLMIENLRIKRKI